MPGVALTQAESFRRDGPEISSRVFASRENSCRPMRSPTLARPQALVLFAADPVNEAKMRRRSLEQRGGAFVLATLATLLSPRFAWTTERAGSHYFQGTYNDFGAAIWGPEGVYVRSDAAYFAGSIGVPPIGGQ